MGRRNKVSTKCGGEKRRVFCQNIYHCAVHECIKLVKQTSASTINRWTKKVIVAGS